MIAIDPCELKTVSDYMLKLRLSQFKQYEKVLQKEINQCKSNLDLIKGELVVRAKNFLTKEEEDAQS